MEIYQLKPPTNQPTQTTELTTIFLMTFHHVFVAIQKGKTTKTERKVSTPGCWGTFLGGPSSWVRKAAKP